MRTFNRLLFCTLLLTGPSLYAQEERETSPAQMATRQARGLDVEGRHADARAIYQ